MMSIERIEMKLPKKSKTLILKNICAKMHQNTC